MRRSASIFGCVLVLACSQQIDTRNRQAFEAAIRPDDLGEPIDDEPGPRPSAPGGPREEVEGWDRVLATMRRAGRILSRSPDPLGFEALAQRWCAFEPEPQATEWGLTRVCVPTPRFVVEGHDLVIELADLGTIGLVARELSDEDSAMMTTRAATLLVELCMEAFRTVAPQTGQTASRQDFQECPIEGGVTLSIGRLPIAGTPTWQVSIAMVSAN